MSLVLLGILNSQAAGGGSAAAYDLLETQVLASPASSVTFSGLGAYSDYKHLQIRAVTSDSLSAAGATWSQLQFNGVTTNSYAWHMLRGVNTNVSANASSPTNSIYCYVSPYGGGATNGFGIATIDILDFANPNKNTTVRSLAGQVNYLGADDQVMLASGLFNSTAAVTSILFKTGNANLTAGSRFSLYGIRG